MCFVAGTIDPTTVRRGALDDWVRTMVFAGVRHGSCDFDGWGAENP